MHSIGISCVLQIGCPVIVATDGFARLLEEVAKSIIQVCYSKYSEGKRSMICMLEYNVQVPVTKKKKECLLINPFACIDWHLL